MINHPDFSCSFWITVTATLCLLRKHNFAERMLSNIPRCDVGGRHEQRSGRRIKSSAPACLTRLRARVAGRCHSGLVSISLVTFCEKSVSCSFDSYNVRYPVRSVATSLSQIYQNITLFFNGILVNFGYLLVVRNF